MGTTAKHVLCLLLFTGFLVAPQPASGNSPPIDTVHLQLKWHHQFQFAGYYAALEKGFYKDEGLNVVIHEGGPNVDVAERIRSGEANFGVLASELVWKRSSGEPLVVLACIIQHSVRALLVRSDSKIASPADLVNKKLMLNKNEYPEILSMFKNEGIDLAALNIVPLTDEAGNKLLRGEIDAMNGSIANQPFMFWQKGMPVATIRPISYGIDFYGDSLFTSEAEIEQAPERVAAFRRASIKGWDYALHNQRELIHLIVQKYNPSKGFNQLQFEAETLSKLILPDLVEIGHINPGRWERIAKAYADFGFIKPGFSIEGFLYDPDAKASLVWLYWMGAILLGIMLLVCVGFSVLWTFNKKLRTAVTDQTATLTQLNKELFENKEKFRQVVESIKEVFWIVSPDWQKVFYVSPAFETLWGISAESLYKNPTSWIDAVVDEDKKPVLDYIEAKSRGDFGTIEFPLYRIVGKNNTVRWISAKGFAIEGPHGAAEKIVGITEDITSKKEAEDVLKASEERLRILYDEATDGIGLADAETGLLVDCNRTLAELVERDKSELIGKPQSILHPVQEHRNGFSVAFQQHRDGRTEHTLPSQLITKTGKRIDVEIKASLFHLKGRNLLLGLFRDISNRKKLENQLHQAQKMQSIGTLAGGIAHDFNNILSSVLGFTELALAEVEKGTSIEENLQEVYTAGKRAKELVRQILAFARQTADEVKPIEVNAIAKEVIKFIRSSIPATIEIQQHISSTSSIMGNPVQVHQILMNLLTNAAQAMEENGGILHVNLKDVVIDSNRTEPSLELEAGNYIELKVSDTGVGIAPEIIGSIFEPYFTTKGMGEGTGMGLAVVQGLVESYSGKITVETTLGKGSTFTIYFPVAPERSNHRPYESMDLPNGLESILFIDDEAPIVRVGTRILANLGYSVISKTDSAEALELFRSNPDDFDLIITDMTMPGMTGDVLAEKMMAIRPNIPVILCTGYNKKMSDERAKEIGIKAFAYKPISKSELAFTVRRALDETAG